jgi:hypothetical protein
MHYDYILVHSWPYKQFVHGPAAHRTIHALLIMLILQYKRVYVYACHTNNSAMLFPFLLSFLSFLFHRSGSGAWDNSYIRWRSLVISWLRLMSEIYKYRSRAQIWVSSHSSSYCMHAYHLIRVVSLPTSVTGHSASLSVYVSYSHWSPSS